MSAFAAAADAWRALLTDSDNLQFLQKHFDTVMAMAIALAQPQAEATVDWDAVRAQFNTDKAHKRGGICAEEQTLLTLVFAIQDVIEVIVRENMAFLVDNATHDRDADSTDQSSASQRDVAAQQDAQVQRLPESFRLAFLTTLRTHWATLRGSATDLGVRLHRLEHMSWRVARPYVLMRIVTSGHQQRILKVPMTQFHELRYGAAKVLQEMNQVEAHPIMRLTNLDQSKPQIRAVQRTTSSTTLRSGETMP